MECTFGDADKFYRYVNSKLSDARRFSLAEESVSWRDKDSLSDDERRLFEFFQHDQQQFRPNAIAAAAKPAPQPPPPTSVAVQAALTPEELDNLIKNPSMVSGRANMVVAALSSSTGRQEFQVVVVGLYENYRAANATKQSKIDNVRL